MGNELSFAHEEAESQRASMSYTSSACGEDPPERSSHTAESRTVSSRDICDSSNKTSSSVATEKVQNLRSSKRRQVVTGNDVALTSHRGQQESVSTSQVLTTASDLTPEVEAVVIQKLKLKSYRAILLHASATGRNAVLNLSYTVSIEPCGLNGQARRVLVTARGTPTVIVQEIPVASQVLPQRPLPPVAVHAY